MRAFFVVFFFFFFSLSVSSSSVYRRVLHQPLFPEATTPPPPDLQSTPPPPDAPDQPFFPENPSTPEQTQTQYPPPPAPPVSSSVNGGLPIPTSTAQPAKPGKKVAIVISVGIVTLGMLSGLAFFLYCHKVKHANDTQKLVNNGDGNDSRRIQEDPRAPTTTTSSTFLYMGTVEPSRESVSDLNGGGGSSVPVNSSPYRKLNSVNGKRSDRYRPSPELQPLPPLSKPQQSDISPSSSSSTPSDEESEYRNASFYTPHGSASDDGYYTPFPRSGNSNGGSNPHSKRTSPRSKFGSTAASRSPEMKHVIIPSIKQKLPTKSPSPVRSPHLKNDEQEVPYSQNKPKFSQPPPPPNRAAFQAITQTPPPRRSPPPPRQTPPPPPPPPPPPLPPPPPQKRPRSFEIERKLSNSEATNLVTSDILSSKEVVNTPILKTKSLGEVNGDSASSFEKSGDGDTDPSRPKLKPLHWDKVRAHSDRATVWDQLKSSSFQCVSLSFTLFCRSSLDSKFAITFSML